jgi:hypothetical protein
VFDNSNGTYTPGLYARLKLVGSAPTAMLIKDEAVGTDLGKKFVLVIDQDNKTVYRSVELGPKLEGLRIVRSGLHKEDTHCHQRSATGPSWFPCRPSGCRWPPGNRRDTDPPTSGDRSQQSTCARQITRVLVKTGC